MENSVTGKVSRTYWQKRRVLVTGHTGFKGSWLCLWLKELGAEVMGLSEVSKDPPYLSAYLDMPALIQDERVNILDASALESSLKKFQPSVIFHLAAQPLVLAGYEDPVLTWNTNVSGTQNLLEAARRTSSVQSIVVATTDKVYENNEWVWGYRESDPLGGHDPYSASKAATEILCSSYYKSYFGPAGVGLCTVRAGNVFGGGDGGPHRIIPDIVRSSAAKQKLELRNPNAIRPWQFVLEPLRGYLLAAQELGFKNTRVLGQAYNFGPYPSDSVPVLKLAQLFVKRFDPSIQIVLPESPPKLHEASLLRLDFTKAEAHLGWNPLISLEMGMDFASRWYGKARGNDPKRDLMRESLDQVDVVMTLQNKQDCV